MQQRDDASTGPGSHLNEGEFHTFLDGQVDVFGALRAGEIRGHLEACAACRDRLAVESSVRDRASAILMSEVGPSTPELPSFADLQARASRADSGAVSGRGPANAPGAGGLAPQTRGRLERRVRWGWAATVVLSLGVGYGVGAWGPELAGEAARSADGASTPSTAEAGPAAAIPTDAISADAIPPEGSPARSAGVPGPAVAAPAIEARQEADQTTASPPPAPPRRTVEETVPAAERVAPIREREASDAARKALTTLDSITLPVSNSVATSLAGGDSLGGALSGSPDSVPASDSLTGRAAAVDDRLNALESVAVAPALRDVADRAAAGSGARLSVGDARPPAQMLRSDAAESTLGSPAPTRVEAADRFDPAADVSLVLEGLTIETLRWMEVWPGQQGLVSTQLFPDGRRVELRIAGPAVGDDGPVTTPPGERTDPIAGWSRVVERLGAGWVALDGPLSPEELGELLATIR